MMYNDFEIYPLFTLLKTITLPWAKSKPQLYDTNESLSVLVGEWGVGTQVNS
jgi:hypothetical protein